MGQASEVHHRMFDLVQSGDYDGLGAMYHDDYVYTDTEGTEQKGAEAGVAVAAMYKTAFPDMQMTIRHAFELGDISIIEFAATGTHNGALGELPPTGRRVNVVGCNIVEVHDGRVWREREYYDTYAMLKQLGVAE